MNPRKRELGVLVQVVGDETVVYDVDGLRAHCLEPLAARIWTACDGERTAAEIAARVSAEHRDVVTPEVVQLTLRRLERAGLMESRESRPAVLSCSRRDLITRVAGIGGLAVFSTVLPTAAQAATLLPDESPCTASSQCASGCCCAGAGSICRPISNCFLGTCITG